MSVQLPPEDEIWYAGDSIPIDFDLTEGDAVLDLTGFDIVFTMKLTADAADNDFDTVQKTLSAGIEVINEALGQILITLDPADTTHLRKTTTFVSG